MTDFLSEQNCRFSIKKRNLKYKDCSRKKKVQIGHNKEEWNTIKLSVQYIAYNIIQKMYYPLSIKFLGAIYEQ